MTDNDSTSLVTVPASVPGLEPLIGRIIQRPKTKRRSPYFGVTIMEPSQGHKCHRLRWKDPDTRRLRHERIPLRPDGTPQPIEVREKLAIDKWHEITARKRQLAGGEERFTVAVDGSIADALNGYLASARVRDKTREAYAAGIRRFLAWCALPAVGVRTCRQLTQAKLAAYGAFLKGKRQLEAKTVNNAFSWLTPGLGELIDRKELMLTREQIRAALRPLKETHVKGDFCRTQALNQILAACIAYDATRTKSQHSGRMLGATLFMLLTGMRPDEAIWIERRDVQINDDGARIHVRAEVAKNGRERWIDLEHSPLLARVVSGGGGPSDRIIGGSEEALRAARLVVIAKHGAPEFDWITLRRTCGTYLACAPGIFGAASCYIAARQLGHSVKVAEQCYYGEVKVSRDARTTEAAMGLTITPSEIRPL